MKNRNILFIIDSLGIGGAEKVILTLADASIKDSSNVNIISCENRVEFEIQSNIKVDILGLQNK